MKRSIFSTKLHTPCQVAAWGLFFFLLALPARAQFNPKSQAQKVTPPKIDTLVKVTAPVTAVKLNLYSDAYDAYLKKIRSKQRNSTQFTGGLEFTQAAFSNWQKGGDNSFAGKATARFEHNYVAPVFSVKSVFDGAYGLIRSDKKTRKNIDFFTVTVTPSWNISKRWKLSSSLNWKSQFTNSYDYPAEGKPIRKASFMAPGTVDLAVGFTYEPPSKKLNILLSPATGKMTFVLDDSLARKGGLGTDKGKKFKTELGAQFRLTYTDKFAKDKISYRTKLETFWNYKDMPTAFWENEINFKFTNVLSSRFYVQFIYDERILTPKAAEDKKAGRPIPKSHYLQISQTFGFGLVVNLKSKAHEPVKESTITKSRLKYLK